MAYIARLTRAGMLEVLGSDYIRTARAKGLSETQVVMRHALRGGLLPVVSYTGPALAFLLTGTVVVERIFALPGLGNILFTCRFKPRRTSVDRHRGFYRHCSFADELARGYCIRVSGSAHSVLSCSANC